MCFLCIEFWVRDAWRLQRPTERETCWPLWWCAAITLWKERYSITVCGYHRLLFSHTFNSCDFLSKRRIRQFTGREGNSNLSNYISQCDKGHSLASQVCQRWKKNPGNQTEYEPIATKEMSSCFKKDFSSDQKLMHLIKLGVISRDLFYSKDENLGLIDVKSPTASCWWNENLDLVNTPRHSFSSSQWDCSEVIISLIWKKKYIKFFVFFITEVQCIFF